jgi:hypothetical protein
MRVAAMVALLLCGCGSSPVPQPDAGNDGGCGAGSVIAVSPIPDAGQTANVTFSCFSGQGPNFSLGTTAQVSGDGLGWQENGGPNDLVISFASSSSCSFDAGQVVPLTDNCITIVDGNSDQNLGPVVGFENVCNIGTNPITTGLITTCTGNTSVTMFTAGSLTLNQWSAGTVQGTFSSDAQLTGVANNAGGATQYIGFGVPLSGTFTASY